jgi:hypothetical protein
MPRSPSRNAWRTLLGLVTVLYREEGCDIFREGLFEDLAVQPVGLDQGQVV